VQHLLESADQELYAQKASRSRKIHSPDRGYR
jgi:hypothetical protein